MIDLTRRRFLKWVGIGALAFVVPMVGRTVKAGPLTDHDQIPVKDISIESRRAGFNPNYEYGRAAEGDGLKEDFVLHHLHRDAKRFLPKGIPYEIRRLIPSVVEYPERKVAMAWYYYPGILRESQRKGLTHKSWQRSAEIGCDIMGVFYA